MFAPDVGRQVESRNPVYELHHSLATILDLGGTKHNGPGREFEVQGEAIWFPPFYEFFENDAGGVILEDLTFFLRFERASAPEILAAVDFQPNALPFSARGWFLQMPFSRLWIRRRPGARTRKRFYVFQHPIVMAPDSGGGPGPGAPPV